MIEIKIKFSCLALLALSGCTSNYSVETPTLPVSMYQPISESAAVVGLCKKHGYYTANEASVLNGRINAALAPVRVDNRVMSLNKANALNKFSSRIISGDGNSKKYCEKQRSIILREVALINDATAKDLALYKHMVAVNSRYPGSYHGSQTGGGLSQNYGNMPAPIMVQQPIVVPVVQAPQVYSPQLSGSGRVTCIKTGYVVNCR